MRYGTVSVRQASRSPPAVMKETGSARSPLLNTVVCRAPPREVAVARTGATPRMTARPVPQRQRLTSPSVPQFLRKMRELCSRLSAGQSGPAYQPNGRLSIAAGAEPDIGKIHSVTAW